MSKGNPRTANLVIEWSPKGITAFDGVTRTTKQFDSVQAAASNLGAKPVIVAVSRRVVFIRTTRVPDAALADVRLVLSMRLGDLFPLPSTDLAYDFVLTDNVDSDGRLAVVAAMSAPDLRRLHEECRAAGFKVTQVIPVAFGSVLVAETLGRTSGAVVNHDDDGIGIDIVEGRHLRYSRVTSNIASPAAEVGRTYTVAGLPCGDMIGAGGFNFPDVDIVSKDTSLEAFLTSSHEMPHVNLELPELVALRAKRARDGRQRLAILLFVAALAMCGVGYSSYSSKTALVEKDNQKNQADLKKGSTIQKADETKAASLADAQATLDLAFKYGQRYSDVATVVANDVPSGVWLGGFSVERGKRLVLRGVAFSNSQVHDYVIKLSSEPRLRSVRLEFANDGAIDMKPVVQFSISAFPVGNVPLVDPNKVKRK
ncbi:MAG: PilN domain-containing protein [Fimbriimonas sp.]|nr:PilN domain-containing protein [Fimbriimonas sp.]